MIALDEVFEVLLWCCVFKEVLLSVCRIMLFEVCVSFILLHMRLVSCCVGLCVCFVFLQFIR